MKTGKTTILNSKFCQYWSWKQAIMFIIILNLIIIARKTTLILSHSDSGSVIKSFLLNILNLLIFRSKSELRSGYFNVNQILLAKRYWVFSKFKHTSCLVVKCFEQLEKFLRMIRQVGYVIIRQLQIKYWKTETDVDVHATLTSNMGIMNNFSLKMANVHCMDSI